MSTNTQKKHSDAGFSYGKWGWSMIIMCLIAYFIAGGVGTDGLNIYVNALAGIRGWDSNAMLAFSTYGGWIAVIVTFILGDITARNMKATKPIMIVTTLLTAVAMYFYGHTTNYAVYGISVACVSILAVGYSQIAPNNIQTNFFPRRKAIVLGISTIGFPLCTMIWPNVCNRLMGAVGVEGMFTAIAIFVAVFGIAQIFWCKVTPEEVGAAPDNDPMSKEEIEASMKAMREYKSPWTLKKLLSEKRTWFISIGLGLMWMVTVSIVSRLVPRLMSLGMERGPAVGMLSVVGFFGIFGSYIWGWIDQKFGTKKASLIYCVWYAVALVLLIMMQSKALMYIGVFMVGISVGGICNLIPSMVGTIFGRKDFAAANRFISAVTKGICACAYLYMGKMTASVGMTGAYVGLIVVCAVAFILIALIQPLKVAKEA